MSLEAVIQKLMSIRRREFSRLRVVDLQRGELSTDCMGMILFLMENQRATPGGITKSSKVIDLFESCLNSPHKTNIKNIQKNDLLMWKKDSPPSHGDTGHVLLVRGLPRLSSSKVFTLPILEVSRYSNGPCEREIALHTCEQGEITSVQWHPESKKVKKTQIIAKKVFKREMCSHCHFSSSTCLCSSLPSTKWQRPPFKIIQDIREKKVAIRSSRILELCFTRSQDLYYQAPFELSPHAILVYPTKGAKVLEKEEDYRELRGRNLILLDGSWNQVKAQLLKTPQLRDLKAVQFVRETSPLYKIRKAPSEQHFSTLETFSFLWSKVYPENISKAEKLEEIFSTMVSNQIDRMGRETYLNNYSHYPGFEN